MNDLEMKNLLERRLQRFTVATLENTYFQDELIAARDRLEKAPVLPDFLLTELSSTEVTVGESRVGKPSDFLALWERGEVWYEDPTTLKLIPIKRGIAEELIPKYSGVANGKPKEYAIAGDYIRLFPSPDVLFNLKMIYYQSSGAFDYITPGTNRWSANYPDLLIAEAGIYMARVLGSPGGDNFFTAMQQREAARLTRHEVSLESGNYVAEAET